MKDTIKNLAIVVLMLAGAFTISLARTDIESLKHKLDMAKIEAAGLRAEAASLAFVNIPMFEGHDKVDTAIIQLCGVPVAAVQAIASEPPSLHLREEMMAYFQSRHNDPAAMLELAGIYPEMRVICDMLAAAGAPPPLANPKRGDSL